MCQGPLVGVANISGTRKTWFVPWWSSQHKGDNIAYTSAKPSVWVGKASCPAGQEGQLRKQGKEGLWEEVALSSGLSDKQLLGVVSPRCGQRTSLACYFMSKVMSP